MDAVTPLTDLDALEAQFTASHQRPLLLFKHSLVCPISDMAFAHYRDHLRKPSDDVTYTLIEIQNARPVSKAVEARTGVRHESPQALLVKDGEVVWHASHGSITRDSIETALAEHA